MILKSRCIIQLLRLSTLLCCFSFKNFHRFSEKFELSCFDERTCHFGGCTIRNHFVLRHDDISKTELFNETSSVFVPAQERGYS